MEPDEPLATDPFEGVVLDAAFIGAATTREPAAAERSEAAARAAAHGRRTPLPRTARRAPWTRRALDRFRAPVLVVTLLAMLGATIAISGATPGAARWDTREVALTRVGSADRPPPQRAASTVPLGAPALPTPPGGGPHAYVATQERSAAPVTYDPCRPIPVVLQSRAAPPLGDVLVRDALAQATRATGLTFTVEGTTAEAPTDDRAAYQSDPYGDRWAPVLIAWSDEQESPLLAGDVAGFAGSSMAIGDPSGRAVFVTGQIVLDGPQLTEILASRDGRAAARGVVMHELGHLVGLDHTDDPTQLMYPEGQPGVTAFGAGDLEGLAELGRGTCIPEL